MEIKDFEKFLKSVKEYDQYLFDNNLYRKFPIYDELETLKDVLEIIIWRLENKGE